jgi:hypothetical protein
MKGDVDLIHFNIYDQIIFYQSKSSNRIASTDGAA